VEQFIARKADILFCPTWRTAVPREDELEDEEATGEDVQCSNRNVEPAFS
jgi:hypothetical protein